MTERFVGFGADPSGSIGCGCDVLFNIATVQTATGGWFPSEIDLEDTNSGEKRTYVQTSRLAELHEVIRRALAYDAAIRKRVVDRTVMIMETGGAVAMGDDLDQLYESLMAAARTAFSPAEIAKPDTAASPAWQ